MLTSEGFFAFEFFLTFSGRKFSGPDFYLLSTLCGPAATPWIWRPHYKRVKVNILSFGNSKMFSLFVSKNQERTGKNCITEWNVSKKSILGHGRQFGFPPSVKSRICPPVEDVFVPSQNALSVFNSGFSVPLIVRLSSLLTRESVFKLFLWCGRPSLKSRVSVTIT